MTHHCTSECDNNSSLGLTIVAVLFIIILIVIIIFALERGGQCPKKWTGDGLLFICSLVVVMLLIIFIIALFAYWII